MADEAEDLLVSNSLCPGDVIVQTAAIRDLHRAYPGRFRTAMRTAAMDIWNHNPFVVPATQLVNPRTIGWGWTANESNERYRHLIQIWCNDLAAKIGSDVSIPMTDICGDLYLSQAEELRPTDLLGFDGPYAVINAGWKDDARTKHWGVSQYQAVVYGLAGRVKFVQVGRKEPSHHHEKLRGVVDLLGKTDARQLMRVIRHSSAVVCGITFCMHLSAALPTTDGRLRPTFVIAGGREPVHMIQYPGHTVFSAIGAIPCAAFGSCWKDQVKPGASSGVGVCHMPTFHNGETLASCMKLLSAARVIAAIEACVDGGTIASFKVSATG